MKAAPIFALLFAFVVQAAQAGLRAPDFTLQATRQSSKWTVVATAPVSHHFNTKAPMSLLTGAGVIKPSGSSEKEVSFEVPTQAGNGFRIALYLCDDAKTFCEKHEVQYMPDVRQAQSVTSAPSTGASQRRGNSPKIVHGFILNDPAGAFARAQRENKPVIVDFFGIWCPPCNELDEKIFTTREFTRSASRFVRLKLDADSPVSWELKSRFHVTGYPTVVFATSQGDEISRIIGFRPKADFLAELDDAWKSRATPLASLEEKARAGDRDAADRAGVILLNRGRSAEAAKLLAQSQAKREFWHLAEIDQQDQDNAPAEKRIARLNQAIAEFSKSPNTIDWYSRLAGIYEERKEGDRRKAALKQAIDLSLELAQHPEKLKGYDATGADLLESEADYREQLDGKERARQDWLAAAHAYEQRGVGSKERANNLEMAFCLGKAGEIEKARAVYEKLERAYPDEFTFYFNQGRMEREANHLPEALAVASKALERSYGDNKLRTTKLLAQIYQQLGQKDKARELIDETLKNTELPSDPAVRTHRYAEDLKKLRAQL